MNFNYSQYKDSSKNLNMNDNFSTTQKLHRISNSQQSNRKCINVLSNKAIRFPEPLEKITLLDNKKKDNFNYTNNDDSQFINRIIKYKQDNSYIYCKN